jgi:hypothetical protein
LERGFYNSWQKSEDFLVGIYFIVEVESILVEEESFKFCFYETRKSLFAFGYVYVYLWINMILKLWLSYKENVKNLIKKIIKIK